LLAEALKAWWMSWVEKESLRGSWARAVGMGIESVIVAVVAVGRR